MFFYERIIKMLEQNPGLTAGDIAKRFDIPEHAAQFGLNFANKTHGLFD